MIKNKSIENWLYGLSLSDSEPREEIMLFPFGEFSHPKYGKLKFDMPFFNDIIKNFSENVLGIQPFIDQEHDAGKALAWFDDVPYVRQGVGLFVKPSWTSLGKQLLSDKIYKYFSPWFEDFTNPADGKVYKNVLRGGAATNIPFLKTMPAIVNDSVELNDGNIVNIKLSEFSECKNDATANNATAKTTAKATVNKIELHDEDDVQLKNINGGHKMTLEELQKENEKILSECNRFSSEVKKLSDENASLKKVLAEKEVSLNDSKIMAEKLTALEAKIKANEAESVIGKALSEGKIMPKDREYWMKRYIETPERTKEDVEHLSVAISLSEVGVGGESAEESNDPAKLLDEKVRKYADEKNIKYGDAYDVIAKKEHDLVARVAKTQYVSRRV